MKPIVCFALVLFGYISISEVSSVEDCRGAKYLLKNLDGAAFFICTGYGPCAYNINLEKMYIVFHFTVPEEISDVYYNVSLVGNNITAGSSGMVKPNIIENNSRVGKTAQKNTSAVVTIGTKVEGNMTKGESNATVKLYFNEPMKDTPDICVTTKLILIDHK